MGLLDLVMGSGDYADPTKMDPTYGVPLADSRQAMFNAIGNMGAILMAAGQKISPEQRAAYLGQLGQVGPQATNDMMTAAQRRLLQGQMAEKQREMEDLRALDEERRSNPDEIARVSRLPVDYIRRMPIRDLKSALQQITVAQATKDPMDALVKQAQLAASVAGTEKTTAETRRIIDEDNRKRAAYDGFRTVYGLNAPQTGAPTAPTAASTGAPGQPQRALDPSVVQMLIETGTDPVKIAEMEAEAAGRNAERRSAAEKDLRGEFTAATKDFQSRQAAYKTMQDLARQGEGASDMALVMSLMKVYDPTSTVTGGEAANAQNAAGVPEGIRAQYNMLIGGGKLSQTARSQLVNAAKQRYNQEMDAFGTALDRYTTLARDTYKVRPEAVVTDYRDPEAVQMRNLEKERAAISRQLQPLDILRLNMDDIAVLDTSAMSAKQRETLAFRIRQLETDPNKTRRFPGFPNAPTPIPAPPAIRGETPRTTRY